MYLLREEPDEKLIEAHTDSTDEYEEPILQMSALNTPPAEHPEYTEHVE